jgi:hypothetical protein
MPNYKTKLVANIRDFLMAAFNIQRSYLSQKHSLLPPCVIGTDATAMVIVLGYKNVIT